MPDTSQLLKKFEDILKRMAETFSIKNADYGNSQIIEFGLLGLVIRMNDKMSRLKSIVKSDAIKVREESLEDTLMDQAVYSVMSIMYLHGDFFDEEQIDVRTCNDYTRKKCMRKHDKKNRIQRNKPIQNRKAR
jgi:hypothetical protein